MPNHNQEPAVPQEEIEAEFHLPGVEALRREEMWGMVHDDTFRTALVTGCAGSGKTTIAVCRLIRHAEQGYRARLLTFQNMLVLYIKNLVVKKQNKPELDKRISTFHTWYPGSFDTKHPPTANDIRTALAQMGMQPNTPAELLIDEGQDLPVAVFEAVPDYFTRVLVSGDKAQDVHRHPPDHLDRIAAALRNHHTPYRPFPLGQNFRNTYETYRFARQFIPKTNLEVWNQNILDRLHAKNRHGRKPMVVPYRKSAVRDAHMRTVLANARVGSVGILCPIGPQSLERHAGESVESVYRLLASWGISATQYYSDRETCPLPTTLRRYIVTTFISAKGLEFDVVIVPRMNFFRHPTTDPETTIREEMYVASTRARGRLYIYRDQLHPQYDPIAGFDASTYVGPDDNDAHAERQIQPQPF